MTPETQQWCGNCSSPPKFVVRLRDRTDPATEAWNVACGRHLAWAVTAIEETAEVLKAIRAEKSRPFEGEVVVSRLRVSAREGRADD